LRREPVCRRRKLPIEDVVSVRTHDVLSLFVGDAGFMKNEAPLAYVVNTMLAITDRLLRDGACGLGVHVDCTRREENIAVVGVEMIMK
jgi:hypothetical protein